MSEHDDKQFEAYLAGDSPLSEHYRRAGEDGPPAALDARVLEHARRAIAEAGPVATRRRWIAPLSTAAVIVLAAALVLEITLPGVRQEAPRNMAPTVATETVRSASGHRDESVAVDLAEAAADRERMRLTDSTQRTALRKREMATDAVQMPAPAIADDTAGRESPAPGGHVNFESERRAGSALAQESIPARAPAAPSLSYASEPPATAAPVPELPAMASAEPTVDVPEAASRMPVQALDLAAVEDGDGQSNDPAAESLAGRPGDETLARTVRQFAPGGGVAGYAGAPAGGPDLSDEQLQALTLMAIRRMVGEGRDEEAARLLDDALERWPDIELPVDFPLPDPREEP